MSARFHLTHIIPSERLHIFQGYSEIIETVHWGLANLGFEVTYAVNRFQPGAVNVVFGAQMLGVATLETFPRNTIVYNLEQIAGLAADAVPPGLRYCAAHFAVWDYSEFNLPTWRALEPRVPVKHVPIGYAPVLTRIASAAEQDIEVLFYGGPGGNRLRIFHDLCHKLVRTVFVHGLYGKARDGLIARSKLVLNINQYSRTSVFEIARVSYLLANRKAVVSDFSPQSKLEPDIGSAVLLVATETLVDECVRLLADDARRARLEDAGFAFIRRRDIRTILGAALDGANPSSPP